MRREEYAENQPEAQSEVSEDEWTEERLVMLDVLALSLSEQRCSAIDGRALCGIEEQWLEDEQFFEGIDSSVHASGDSWAEKPPGRAVLPNKNTGKGSTVFFNITRPYTEAAAAKMGDMLQPTDDRAFSIKPTPVPELIKIAKGEIPARIERQIDESFTDENGQPAMAVNEVGGPYIDQKTNQQITMAEKTKRDLVGQVEKEVREAEEKAKKAEMRIYDWHVECDFASHSRQVIEDSAKVGSGILKGPIPELKKQVAFINGELKINKEIMPVSRRISYWNFFPDPDCGTNIHNGSFVWEKDRITRKKLAALMADDSYITEQIEKCIKEGPMKAVRKYNDGDQDFMRGLEESKNKNSFEIWYYYGNIEKEKLEQLGIEIDYEADDNPDSVCIHMVMVNNHVIKAVSNHLDTGEFPYDLMPWQRRIGMPWGMGIARQIRTAQRIINAAVRNLMDNAGIAGGPMWAYMAGLVRPDNGNWEIKPRKGWRVSEDSTINDVRKAFTFFSVPMVQKDLQEIIQLALKMAEDVTGMPLILQGQKGDAPDTVGGMQLINNNASTVVRRIVRLYDACITEPHVSRQYRYLLQYGEDDEKGDYQVDARGSTALVERDLQNQSLLNMASIVVNPIFGKDPKKWVDQLLKSQKLSPADFDYDDEEWKKIVESMSKPPSDPAMEVAKLRLQQAEMTETMKTQREAAILQAKQKFEEKEAERDRQLEILLNDVDKEFTSLIEGGKTDVERDKIRERLSTKIMELRTQTMLSENKNEQAKQVSTPPTEPAGRAPDGQAYQS